MDETMDSRFVNGIQLFFKWLFYRGPLKKSQEYDIQSFFISFFLHLFSQLFNDILIIIYLLRPYYGPGIVVDVVDIIVNETHMILQVICLKSRKKYRKINKYLNIV